MRAELSAERVRYLFDYDKDRGVLVVRVSNSNRSTVGKVPSCNSSGYVRIRVDTILYKRSRVIWLHQTGRWPINHIDHINGNRSDDRIENLRDVSRKTNQQNMRKAYSTSSTGLIGSHAHGQKYRAEISLNGKNVHLGVFETAINAHEAYVKAKREFHGGCTI